MTQDLSSFINSFLKAASCLTTVRMYEATSSGVKCLTSFELGIGTEKSGLFYSSPTTSKGHDFRFSMISASVTFMPIKRFESYRVYLVHGNCARKAELPTSAKSPLNCILATEGVDVLPFSRLIGIIST